MYGPSSTSALVRSARLDAGLTQAELAARLGTTQSAIARLENAAANPRIATVVRALAECGLDLVLEARPRGSSVDETLVAENLRLAPAERLQSFERTYANVREFAAAAARSRDGMA